MDYHTISILKSVTFFIMFLLPGYIGIPRGFRAWELWKKTHKMIYLSNAVTFFMAAFFLYVAALVVMIMRLLGVA